MNCIGKCWLCHPDIGCRFASSTTARQHKHVAAQMEAKMGEDHWYERLMLEYYSDGQRDAEKGEVDMPYPIDVIPEDPMESDANEAYKKGHYSRRAELGDKFKWAGE